MRRSAFALAVVLCATSAYAQRVGSHFRRDAFGEKPFVAAPKLASQTAIAPAVTLSAASESAAEKIEAIEEWNAQGRVPAKNGFTRSTIDPVNVFLSSAAVMKSGVAASGRGYVTTTARGIAWSGAFKVERAYRLRLHLEDVSLPAGATMWVYGNGGTPIAFASELVDDHRGVWTPSVDGDTIHLEVEAPSGTMSSFVIRELLEIVPSAVRKPEDATCLVDAACVTTSAMPLIDVLRGATAHLTFVKGSSGFVCTGGLINDREGTGTPYLLTANHCISDQSAASSLEAYWNYSRATCGGPAPSRSASPRSSGSNLMSTSTNSDYTLLKLNSVPSGRWFLGWDASTSTLNTAGLLLYRVSHPFPDEFNTPQPQSYTEAFVDTTGGACSSVPRPRFLYSRNTQGGTWGGSSGSPVVYLNAGHAYIVGQLYGGCGPTGASDCDQRQLGVDGAFASTYAAVAPFIDPGSGVTPAPCVQTANTICLVNNRFAVTARWTTSTASGNGEGVRLTPDTGYFWFFQNTNVEIVVKVLDACGINSRFWVFAGGLTNVNVELKVRDTKTGQENTYTNPLNTPFQPIQATSAFATCP